MKWKKQSGVEVETNDSPETVRHCESLGWKQVKAPAKKAPAKKAARKKAK